MKEIFILLVIFGVIVHFVFKGSSRDNLVEDESEQGPSIVQGFIKRDNAKGSSTATANDREELPESIERWVITMKDKRVYHANVVRESNDEVQFEIQLGSGTIEATFDEADILTMEKTVVPRAVLEEERRAREAREAQRDKERQEYLATLSEEKKRREAQRLIDQRMAAQRHMQVAQAAERARQARLKSVTPEKKDTIMEVRKVSVHRVSNRGNRRRTGASGTVRRR